MTPHRKEEEPSFERKHYPFSDRRGNLRLIASPDGSAASLRLQQDVRIYSSVLDPGRHMVHELRPGRGGWLQVVAGRVLLVDQSLEAGDGASLDDEPAVSFTAQVASEILLFDLA
jgi:redox-sensitive bicupin YhaK (pirin superfamily)